MESPAIMVVREGLFSSLCYFGVIDILFCIHGVMARYRGTSLCGFLSSSVFFCLDFLLQSLSDHDLLGALFHY